jgi:hypothetical protein
MSLAGHLDLPVVRRRMVLDYFGEPAITADIRLSKVGQRGFAVFDIAH